MCYRAYLNYFADKVALLHSLDDGQNVSESELQAEGRQISEMITHSSVVPEHEF